MKLIFIHGSGGTGLSFRRQTEYFKGSIAPDLPGHPDGEPCAAMEGYAEWFRGIITCHGYRDVVLAGHSLGGGIALTYALAYPGELRGLILLGSGTRLRVLPAFLDILEKAKTDPALFDSMIDPMHAKIDPKLALALKERALETGPAVMLNDMRACDAFSIMGREKEITIPVLALCGSEDMMTPPKYSAYVADTFPSARAVIIEGGTHFVFAEQPGEVNREIETFLAGFGS